MLILDEFEKLLLTYQNRRFTVVNPQGSKGDQLIFMGMEKKLKEFKINYKVCEYRKISSLHEKCLAMNKKLSQVGLNVSPNFFLTKTPILSMLDKKASTISNSGDIFLLRGGAYLNDIWKEYHVLVNVLRILDSRAKSTLIFAPQSYFFTSTQFPRFFKWIKNETHIFCREKYSYDLLRSMSFPKHVKIYLSPDTALYLCDKDFDPQKQALRDDYVLIAPRYDQESAVVWKVKKVPKQKKILFGDIIYLKDFKSFVDIVKNASEIYTDRLHVTILSAILGKETYIYPNSYHKNKGVYEFTLHSFPNVKYIDSYEFLGVES